MYGKRGNIYFEFMNINPPESRVHIKMKTQVGYVCPWIYLCSVLVLVVCVESCMLSLGNNLCVCVCVCGLVRTYIRGQFCVFNHLTGDVRQVGTSPDVFTSPINFLSHFEHV